MVSLKDLPDQLRLEIRKSDLENFLREMMEIKEVTDPVSDYQPAPKEILTVNDAANLTGLAKQTIYTKVSRREIPHYKAKRKVYFKRTELIEWMLGEKRDTQTALQLKAADFIENQKVKRKKP